MLTPALAVGFPSINAAFCARAPSTGVSSIDDNPEKRTSSMSTVPFPRTETCSSL